jgi:hypothetical protein
MLVAESRDCRMVEGQDFVVSTCWARLDIELVVRIRSDFGLVSDRLLVDLELKLVDFEVLEEFV